MADWRNRMEQIVNKFKFQLNAKGIDNIQQLKDIFMVSPIFPLRALRAPPFLSSVLITAI